MNSKSKYELTPDEILALFRKAGFANVENVAPLGAGEYNSVYRADADGKPCVLKVAPSGDRCALTYERDMMRQEVFYYGKMRDAGIGVPEIYYSDFSKQTVPAEWFIMERLAGSQLDLADLNVNERKTATKLTAEMVAKLHMTKADGCGYRQNGLEENWYLALRKMVLNLLNDAERFHRRSRRGTRLLKAVDENKELLSKVECRLINFDIWAPNIFVERAPSGLVVRWIDPERCLYGDRIGDFVPLGSSAGFTLDSRTEVIGYYNAVSDQKIEVNRETRIRFSLMLGYLSLVMEVEKYARYSPFRFGWWRNVAASAVQYRAAIKTLNQCRKR